MSDHDPAGCGLAFCQRCDDYGSGYAAGKDKAYFELEMMASDYDHAAGCGCRPCATIRRVLAVHGNRRAQPAGMQDLHEAMDFPPAPGGNLGADY